jgi:hypothetical protein
MKRRAVLSLYLLHWAFSTLHGIESYECAEIAFMPAPAAKVLWQATSEAEWEVLYDRWLARWDGKPFLQREFWTIEPGVVMNPRAERWLGESDEFGYLHAAIGKFLLSHSKREKRLMLQSTPRETSLCRATRKETTGL